MQEYSIVTLPLSSTPPALPHTAWDGEVFTSNIEPTPEYFNDLGAMFTAKVRGGAYACINSKNAVGASELEKYNQYRGRITNAHPTSVATELHRLHMLAIAVKDQFIRNHEGCNAANGCGVAIEPTYRKNNLASQLCEQRNKLAKEAGFTHLFVDTTGYSSKLMKKLGATMLLEQEYSFPCEWKFITWVIEL